MEFILFRLLKNNIISYSDIEEYRYALKVLILKAIHLILILCVGFIFQIIDETILFLVVYSIIRQRVGGYHSKSPYICFLLSIIFIIILSLILQEFKYLSIFVLPIILCLSIYFFSVVNNLFFKQSLLHYLVIINLLALILLIFSQHFYLLCIAYAFILNFFLFGLGKLFH